MDGRYECASYAFDPQLAALLCSRVFIARMPPLGLGWPRWQLTGFMMSDSIRAKRNLGDLTSVDHYSLLLVFNA